MASNTSRIRWGRIVAAAVLSEIGVVLALGVVIAAHRFLIAPGKSAAEYDAFAEIAAYYVAPTAAGICTFLAALWAGHRLPSGFVAHGVLVGVAGVILSIGFVFFAKPEERLMYGVSLCTQTRRRISGGRHDSTNLKKAGFRLTQLGVKS